MQQETQAPKIFISYSWSSKAHEEWVLELAERLVSDGIHVILDKWDLKEGHDKYAFMEQMVTDETVSKVLVVCDEQYAHKANSRRGGVGTESQIISNEIYSRVDHEEFLPIVTELDPNGRPYLPVYLKNRIYIDLSSDEKFYSEYEKLLRSIYGKPSLKRPPIGTAPDFLSQEKSLSLTTYHRFYSFREAITKDRKHAQATAVEYLRSLLGALEEFKTIDGDDPELDERIVRNIGYFKPYRDEFIEFVRLTCAYSKESTYCYELFEFLEKSIPFIKSMSNDESEADMREDNYRFILWELFLYIISILIKHRRYSDIAIFLDDQYYYSTGKGRGHAGHAVFNSTLTALDEIRKKRLELQELYVSVELLKERADDKDISFEDLMQTDLIICMRGLLANRPHHTPWFPRTLACSEHSEAFELFHKAQSKRNFEIIKTLLDVSSKKDLMNRFRKAYDQHKLEKWMFNYRAIPFAGLMNLNNLDRV